MMIMTPLRYERIEVWEQKTTILQGRKQASIEAARNYGNRVSFVLWLSKMGGCILLSHTPKWYGVLLSKMGYG